jgi:cysteine desulfurase / selenocysteine lyase
MTDRPALDLAQIREDFPALNQSVRGKSLVYLDSGASAQTPRHVLAAINKFYLEDRANIHRGVHVLSQRATASYEKARVSVQEMLGAAESREIIFTRGTTEAINLLAQTYGRSELREGDEILISHMEHHSNIVPWQLLCEQTGAKLKVAPIDDAGDIIFEAYEELLSERTKIVSIVHVSNALGTINPVKKMIDAAHDKGAIFILDGAQAVPHMAVDVQQLDCDFYAFSGHKYYGPTGIGVLYGKADLLQKMPPYEGGGDMILSVTFEKTKFNDLPYKFEAGTPNIAGVIGLGAAVEYMTALGMDAVSAHEARILEYGTEALKQVPGLKLIGTAKKRAAVLSFVLDGIHPHDLGTIVDSEGVAIRTGHHCAQPVMDRYGIPATARASLGIYNTEEDIDRLVLGLKRAIELFG